MMKQVVGILLTAGCVFADSTWTGSGTDANWSDTANWLENQAPSGGLLSFGGSAKLTNTNDLTGLAATGFSFLSGAGAFVLEGHEIAVGTSVANNSSSAQRLKLPLNFTGQAELSGASSIYLDGALRGSGFIKKGDGTVYVSGDTSGLTGPAVISNKLVQVSGGTNGFPGGIAISYNQDAGLALNSEAVIAGQVTVFGKSSGYYAIESQGAGLQTTNVIDGKLAVSGQIRLGINNSAPSVLQIRGGVEDVTPGDGAIFVLNSNRGEIRISDKPVNFSNRIWYQDNGLVTIAVAGNNWSWMRRSGGETRVDVTNGLAVGKAVQLFGAGVLNLNGCDQQIGNLYGWYDAVPSLIKSQNPAVLTVTQGADASYLANLAGAVTLRKQGNSSLYLCGTNNTQTGKLIVDAGRLGVDRMSGLGAVPAETVPDKITIGNGATFLYQDLASVAAQYATNCPAAETLQATQGITVPSGTGYLRIGTGRKLTVESQVSGGGALTKNGDGTLVISPDLLGVPVTVTAGTLELSAPSDGARAIAVSAGGTLAFAPTTSAVAVSALNLQNLSFADNSILALDSSRAPDQYLTVQGVIANPASGASLRVDKIGAGTALLSDANTFTGGVWIKEGTLSVPTFPMNDEPSPLGIATTNGAAKLTFAGGTLEYTGAADVLTYRLFTRSAGQGARICVTNAGTRLWVANYQRSNGWLIKTGEGTLRLTRNDAKSSGANIGGGPNYILGGILETANDDDTTGRFRIQQNIGTPESSGPAVRFGDGAALRYDMPLQIQTQGARQLVDYVGVSRRATMESGWTICGPTNEPGNTITFAINDGTDDIDFVTKGGLNRYPNSGTYSVGYTSILKAGDGTWKISSGNWRGATILRAGRILVPDSIPAGGTSCSIGVSTNLYGVVFGDALTTSTNRPSLIYDGTAASFSYVRGTYIHTNAYAQIGSVSNIAVTVNAVFGLDGILGFCSYTTNHSFSVNCALNGIGGIAKTGPGVVNLSAANGYEGATIVEAGTLRVNADGAIPNGRKLVLNGGYLNLNGRTVSFGTLTVGGDAVIDAAQGLVFADSSAAAWNGTLTFANRTSAKIYFGTTASGLTAAQLEKITLPAGCQKVLMGSDGELIFIPKATLMLLK